MDCYKFDGEPVKADLKSDDTKTEGSKPDNSTNNTNITNNTNSTNNNNTKTAVPATGDSNTVTMLAIFGSLISAAAVLFTRRKKSV